jgi:hypothetical protein
MSFADTRATECRTLEVTTVSVEGSVGSLIISAVYLPPKHIVKQEQLETSSFDLSSDHSPVILYSQHMPSPRDTAQLSNRRTNWDLFRLLITERPPLPPPQNDWRHRRGCQALHRYHPMGRLDRHAELYSPAPHSWVPYIHQTWTWRKTKTPQALASLKNSGNQTITEPSYTGTETTSPPVQKFLRPNFSTKPYADCVKLLKTAKKLKRVTKSSPLRTPHGTWTRSATEKAHAFPQHLASVFQPYPSGPTPVAEEAILQFLDTRFSHFECCILLRSYLILLWHRQSQPSFNRLTPFFFFSFFFYSLHVSAPTGHPQVRYTISYYFCFLKDYFNTTDPLHACNSIFTSPDVICRH